MPHQGKGACRVPHIDKSELHTIMGAMTDTDLAYLAGFFDSRGSIFLQRYSTPRGPNYVLGVSIYEQDRNVLESIGQFFGAGKIYRSKQGFELRFPPREAYKVVTQLEPLLRIKKPQAQLAIEFHSKKTRQRPLSDEERRFRAECYERMRALNAPK